MAFHVVAIILALLLIKSPIEAKQSRVLQVENVHDKLVKLLELCFSDHLSTVVVTPDLSGLFHRKWWTGLPPPLIVFDDNFQKSRGYYYGPDIAKFILTAHSREKIEKKLQHLKVSPWWSIHRLFILVDGFAQQTCDNVLEILQTAWKMNLQSILYVCNQNNEDVMLYTFNPYTNRAPRSWKKVKIIEKSTSQWTLYNQRLQVKDKSICAHLNFDKTKHLDGYQINAVGNPQNGVDLTTTSDEHDISSLPDKMSMSDANLFQTIFTVMNVTAKIHYYPPGYRSNGIFYGWLPKLINGTYDISLSKRFFHFGISSTYPLDHIKVCILSQHTPFLEPLEKIRNFYSTGAVCLTILVLAITLVIMTIYTKRGIAAGFFETQRVLLSVGMMQPIKATSIRIYFFGVFWLIIILNATFQGNIAAFLTRPERHDMESIEDLEIHHYHVYVPSIYRNYLPLDWTQLPEDHIHYVNDYDCFNYVLNDSSAACVQAVVRLLHPAAKYGVHISEKPVSQNYAVYWCRNDWPLLQTLDNILFRLMESGLLHYWSKEDTNNRWNKLRQKEAQDTAPIVRSVKVQDLAFALKFLVFALIISTIVFICEIRSKTRTPRRRIPFTL